MSKASRLLLKKGAAYQNDIKEVKLWTGAPGTTFERTSFLFQLSDQVIAYFSWQYKFYNVVENKVRNCKIYSPDDHFFNTGLTFKYNNSTYTVEIDDKNQNIIGTFDYERYNFDFDSVHQDKHVFYI